MSSFAPCVPKYPQSSAATIYNPSCFSLRENAMTNKDWMFPIDAHKSDQEVANLRASLGADHMQPVVPMPWPATKVCACGDHYQGVGDRCPLCADDEYLRSLENPSMQTAPQPAPAPREISDAECDAFTEKAFAEAGYAGLMWRTKKQCNDDRAISRYAIRQLESRAPQTAPRDPYKRGQLLP